MHSSKVRSGCGFVHNKSYFCTKMNLIPRSNALILLLFFACTCNAQYFSQDYSPIQYSRLETGTLTEIRKSYEETYKSLTSQIHSFTDYKRKK